VRFTVALNTIRVTRDTWTYVIGMSLIMELTGIMRRKQRADLGKDAAFSRHAGSPEVCVCVMPTATTSPSRRVVPCREAPSLRQGHRC
jgi:hypothetical protein